MRIGFHRRIGLAPGWGLVVERYGVAGSILLLRLHWAALTLTWKLIG